MTGEFILESFLSVLTIAPNGIVCQQTPVTYGELTIQRERPLLDLHVCHLIPELLWQASDTAGARVNVIEREMLLEP